MVYFSKKSSRKTLHSATCYHLGRTPETARGEFSCVTEGYRAGYTFCRHCDPLVRQAAREKDAIEAFCARHALYITEAKHTINVFTPYSRWKLVTDGEEPSICLYHRNSRKMESDADSAIPKYHLQGDARFSCILDYLNYISEHDLFRMQHPLAPRPRTAPPPPPKKGTARYKKEQKKQKRQKRQGEIRRVMELFDTLHA